VAITLGDQWTDLVQITGEEQLEQLDLENKVDETPWVLCAIDDSFSLLGLKLMAQD
jgi:hypothetical protein